MCWICDFILLLNKIMNKFYSIFFKGTIKKNTLVAEDLNFKNQNLAINLKILVLYFTSLMHYFYLLIDSLPFSAYFGLKVLGTSSANLYTYFCVLFNFSNSSFSLFSSPPHVLPSYSVLLSHIYLNFSSVRIFLYFFGKFNPTVHSKYTGCHRWKPYLPILRLPYKTTARSWVIPIYLINFNSLMLISWPETGAHLSLFPLWEELSLIKNIFFISCLSFPGAIFLSLCTFFHSPEFFYFWTVKILSSTLAIV